MPQLLVTFSILEYGKQELSFPHDQAKRRLAEQKYRTTLRRTGQVRLIAELDEKDKSIIFGLIETMLTKKKFKDFFNKNVAML